MGLDASSATGAFHPKSPDDFSGIDAGEPTLRAGAHFVAMLEEGIAHVDGLPETIHVKTMAAGRLEAPNGPHGLGATAAIPQFLHRPPCAPGRREVKSLRGRSRRRVRLQSRVDMKRDAASRVAGVRATSGSEIYLNYARRHHAHEWTPHRVRRKSRRRSLPRPCAGCAAGAYAFFSLNSRKLAWEDAEDLACPDDHVSLRNRALGLQRQSHVWIAWIAADLDGHERPLQTFPGGGGGPPSRATLLHAGASGGVDTTES